LITDAGTDPSSTITYDTQTENRGNDIKSTQNNAGGRYKLRNLDSNTVNYKSLHKIGKQYAQITKAKKERKLYVRDMFKKITAICMTQMTAKKGIATYGEVAIQAILKEYKQLHDLNVFQPMKIKDIPVKERDKVLRLITLIKEKRTGQIKGRACADGRPQRAYISREEATSPTVGLESLMLSLMVDPYEKRDVVTADVAGAFLKGNIDDFVMIKLINEEVDIMCKVDPKYGDYVIYGKNGRRKLFIKLIKAFIWMCEISHIIYIWYEKLL